MAADPWIDESIPLQDIPKKIEKKSPAPSKEEKDPYIDESIPLQDLTADYLKRPAYAESIPQSRSLMSGVGQGASFGFGDELMAALEAATGPQTYRENWLRKQAELAAEEKAWPKTFGSGEVAANIGTSFIPGVGWVGAAGKTASAASKLGKMAQLMKAGAIAGARQGAIEGVGKSQTPYSADTSGATQAFFDSLKGAGIGAAGGGIGAPLGAGIGKGIQALGEGAKAVAPKVAPFMFNLEEKVAKEIAENPDAYKGPVPKSMEEIANPLIERINSLSKATKEGDQAARAMLTSEQAVSEKEAVSILKNKLKKLGAINEVKTQKDVLNEAGEKVGTKTTTKIIGKGKSDLSNLKQEVKAMAGKKGYLTEKDTKRLMDTVETYINRAKVESGDQTSKALKAFKGSLNQKLEQNPGFKEAMIPVAKDTDFLAKTTKKLGLKRSGKAGEIGDEGEYIAPDRYDAEAVDTVVKKLKNIRNSPDAQNILKKLNTEYGAEDYAEAAKRFTNEQRLGIRKPFVGSGVGTTLGGIGALAGLGPASAILPALGIARDIYGPKAYKALMTSGGMPNLPTQLSRPGFVAGRMSGDPFLDWLKQQGEPNAAEEGIK